MNHHKGSDCAFLVRCCNSYRVGPILNECVNELMNEEWTNEYRLSFMYNSVACSTASIAVLSRELLVKAKKEVVLAGMHK